MKPVLYVLLGVALISAIVNVIGAGLFVVRHRELQSQANTIQMGAGKQQQFYYLINQLGPYAQKDPQIMGVLNKYGIGMNPNARNQNPQ